MKDPTKEFSSRSQNQKNERKVESDNPTTKNKDSLNQRPARGPHAVRKASYCGPQVTFLTF
jgi:hypothetical protein